MGQVAAEPPSDRPAERVVVLVAGGDGPVRALPPIPADAVVVAADSGVDRARTLGLEVHHAVGDFDSVTAEGLRWAGKRGAVLHRHEADKDATDIELALDLALDDTLVLPPARLVLIGGAGGRLDHELANLALLTSDRLADVAVEARLGSAVVAVVRPGRPVSLPAEVGEVLSLLPAGMSATGVTSSGVRWPLVDADLLAGSTRGLSNEVTEPVVSVACASGVLLVVLPGERVADVPRRTGPYDPSPRVGSAAADPTETATTERNPR